MNTSKQVNVMIGLMFLAFATFAGYMVYEGPRAESAGERQEALLAERGAQLYVNNCRSCHGLEGKGQEEGGIAPALNRTSFLIMAEGNPQGVPATPDGEAQGLHDFLFNTLSCGRTNTAMPVWSERYGGPLSETQIGYIVTMITTGRWDLVIDYGHHHDEETGDTAETILISDPSTLSLTTKNCGQYNLLTAREFYDRDPLAPAPTEPVDGEATPTPGGEPAPVGATVQGLAVGDFFLATCATCHGQQRQGLIGPALTPERLSGRATDELIGILTNGVPGTAMPSWAAAGLTADEIAALVEYITTVAP
ncbi:MAG: c-type cytochrome [Chloroflexi bacterium]|nr:c-type cytochrome [Chloroflexota bacterium]MDA1240165.1 c-type cytochrome [Chloroflexota bacterium]